MIDGDEFCVRLGENGRASKSGHGFGGLVFATSRRHDHKSSRNLGKMRHCTLARDYYIRTTMSAMSRRLGHHPDLAPSYPRANSVSGQTVLSDSGTSLTRLSMVSLFCFAIFWIRDAIFQGKYAEWLRIFLTKKSEYY